MSTKIFGGEEAQMGNRTYETNNRQYKALIWDYQYTELKLSIINYNNLVMTNIHSCIQWNNTKEKIKSGSFKPLRPPDFTCFSDLKILEKQVCDMSTWVWVRLRPSTLKLLSLSLSNKASSQHWLSVAVGWVYPKLANGSKCFLKKSTIN